MMVHLIDTLSTTTAVRYSWELIVIAYFALLLSEPV